MYIYTRKCGNVVFKLRNYYKCIVILNEVKNL